MVRDHKQMGARPSHILVFLFPVQGHINPMVEFSKRLVSKGVMVTVVTTISASKSMQKITQLCSSGCKVEFISDGSETVETSSETNEESIKRFQAATTKSLTNLIIKIKNSSFNGDQASRSQLKFLVYHSSLPWVLDIARKQGIDGAPFFTCSCAVTAILHHFRQGVLKIPIEGPAAIVPSMAVPLGLNDLHSFLSDVDSYPAFLNLSLNQFSNLEEVKWILCNSFDKLEDEVVKWMTSCGWPVRTVGPTIPSIFLDSGLGDDKGYDLNLFKPNVETCMKWLDSRETGTVVYASFGSMANLGKEQMKELALGLINSNYYFLWVVKEAEEERLHSNFIEDEILAKKGLVVSWCPQLQVLAHKAVGCFVTHCGWNSTLEALSLGVPMVAIPQWADQTTNAKFVMDVWKVGVRVKVNEKGVATNEEIATCIRQVMEEEKGKELRKNSLIWKELAKETVDEGGSSDKNIEEFVAKLMSI